MECKKNCFQTIIEKQKDQSPQEQLQKIAEDK